MAVRNELRTKLRLWLKSQAALPELRCQTKTPYSQFGEGGVAFVFPCKGPSKVQSPNNDQNTNPPSLGGGEENEKL